MEKSGAGRDIKKPPKLEAVWKTGLGIGPRIQPRSQIPAEDGESLFICDARRVLALDLQKGKRLWVTRPGAALTGCLGLFADQLYMTDKDGFAYALNKEDGAVIWQSLLDSESFIPPAANADVLIIQTAKEQLLALNPYEGSVLWIYDAYSPRLSLRGGFPPILLGPYAIAGFADGSLAIIDWRNGNVVSFRQLAVPTGITDIERLVDIDAALIGANNILYLSAYGGSLIAINLAGGRELWRQNFGGSLSLTQDSENLYGIGSENDVFAFRKQDGELVWQADTSARANPTGIAVAGDYILLTDEDGYLSVLSPEDGSLLKRKRIAVTPVSILLTPTGGNSDGVITLDGEGLAGFWRVRPRDR